MGEALSDDYHKASGGRHFSFGGVNHLGADCGAAGAHRGARCKLHPAWSFESVRQLPIYGVATEKKQFAVTFNAAWEADDIPALLAILKQQDVW